jgi:hypothetical protein
MKPILSLLFLLALTNCFSQKLISSRLLPCNNYAENIYRKRIASQRLSHDTLYLEINFEANCSADLERSLRSISDSLFIDLEDVTEIHAACNCCYSMLFTITGIQDSKYKLFVNNREFKFSKSKYIDVPPRNIPKKLLKNELTADSLKVGYWKIKGKKGNYYIAFYGNGSSKNNYPIWIKYYNKKKEVTDVSVKSEEEEDYSIGINPRMYEEILKEKEAIGN